MGRQISVAWTENDERGFLAFLLQSAEVQIFRSFANTNEELFVKEFGAREDGDWFFYIWNRSFPWKPEYAKTKADLPLDRRNLSYISNKSDAPLIEYTRHNFEPGAEQGRIYWGKDFAAPKGFTYDVARFDQWYESIVRWIRKTKKINHAL